MSNTYKINLPNQTYSNYTLGTGSSYNGTWTATNPNYDVDNSVLKVHGTPPSLEVKGQIVINGLDLEERLKIIERILGIPNRDATIEAKYPSVKKKFDEYINTLEKYRTFDRIKGDDNG